MRTMILAAALTGALLACNAGTKKVATGDPGDGGAGGSACTAPLADCDHDGSCETTLGSLESCGACGDVCSSSHAAPSCAEGKCALVCDQDFTDCNGLASDGCEAQLAIDPQNCGACGVSCGAWGDCLAGTCVEILASAAAFAVGADALVIEGEDLYWSSGGIDADGLIAHTPLAGGPTMTLASKQQYADCLHSNRTSLVWNDWGALGIYAMPIGGGTVQTLWAPPGAERPHVLEIDKASVYFTTGGDVRTLPVGGGPATVLATGFVNATAAHLDGGYLYVTDLGPELIQLVNGNMLSGHPEGTVARVTLADGSVETLAQHLDTPVAVTTTSDTLFWVESGTMATYLMGTISANLGTLGRVMRAGLDGSSPAVIADQLTQPADLAADDTHLYWAVAGTPGGKDPASNIYVSDGSLMRAALAGGKPETVMPAVDARKVALSSDTVFFSTWFSGMILAKAKP